jgi:hypothetical protein
MQCPYCVSEISNEALACPNCTRDLYLFKPLLAKIGELEQKVALLDLRLSEVNTPVETPAATSTRPDIPATHPAEGFVLWLSPLLLLLVAHLLITVTYDLNTLYLRIVSLMIPLPFGILLMSRQRRHFGFWAVAAFVMAALAVIGMSSITHFVDHTAILPQDRREWKEFIEYAASVGFSVMTGMLLGRMIWRRREQAFEAAQARNLTRKLATLFSNGQQNAEKIQTSIKKLNDLGSSLAAAGTTAISAYTGLRGFLGDS